MPRTKSALCNIQTIVFANSDFNAKVQNEKNRFKDWEMYSYFPFMYSRSTAPGAYVWPSSWILHSCVTIASSLCIFLATSELDMADSLPVGRPSLALPLDFVKQPRFLKRCRVRNFMGIFKMTPCSIEVANCRSQPAPMRIAQCLSKNELPMRAACGVRQSIDVTQPGLRQSHLDFCYSSF